MLAAAVSFALAQQASSHLALANPPLLKGAAAQSAQTRAEGQDPKGKGIAQTAEREGEREREHAGRKAESGGDREDWGKLASRLSLLPLL